MELQLIDALQWIRARREQFFPSGEAEPIYLLAYLMADILALGGGSCTIRQSGGWWIIGSDIDWLQIADFSESELFGRVVPAPGHGQHSMRAEVLTAAFTRSVWITLGEQRVRIKGDEPPREVWKHVVGLHRAILFTM
ncbi:MAG: hypothetical protein IPK82_17180 [Polyangiaceae bacterium]|nr:hypothetical protein [Polyangiaceae bacterium]